MASTAPPTESSAPTTAAPADAAAATKKPRRVVSSETVSTAFDALQKLIEDHIEELRKAAASTNVKSGSTGIKFLRTVNSRVKQLKKDSVKVMEMSKKRPRRQTKSDGGFLKAHHVTKEFALFAGWPEDAMKSRVDITNAICQYVKAQNLQDPAQRKHILPDEKLRNILQYDPTVPGSDALTYFYLQKLIGKLQVKQPKAEAAKAEPAKEEVKA